MKKKEFILILVNENFASQYEAEQHSYPAGSKEWVYCNPFNKNKANFQEATEIDEGGICLYLYNKFEDIYLTNLVRWSTINQQLKTYYSRQSAA